MKNRKEQLWQSQEALTKAQDHLWVPQRRLEEVTLQRKEEEDQGLRCHGSSGWSKAHGGMQTHQAWTTTKNMLGSHHHSLGGLGGGYQDQPRQDGHKSQCALEDLSVKFAEMQQYIGNITTQYNTFQTEVMLAIQTLTHQQKQSVSVDGHGSAAPATPRASPQLAQSSQRKKPAKDKADGDDSPRKFMVGADDDDLLIDQLGQPSDVQRGLAQETL